MTAPAPLPDEARAPRRCMNCGAALAGPYCAACGQHDQPRDLTFRQMLREAAEELLSVDGRLASTLRAMMHPGRLTTEWAAGRRTRYVSPLKLYLTMSVAYFFAQSLIPDKVFQDGRPAAAAAATDSAAARAARKRGGENFSLTVDGDTLLRAGGGRDPGREDDSAAAARAAMTPAQRDSAARADSVKLAKSLASVPAPMRAGIRHMKTDKRGFVQRMKDNVPRLIFALVPVFAMLLALVYRSRRRRYPQHLWFALHVHAFAFVLLATVIVVRLFLHPVSRYINLLLIWVALPIYPLLAMRAVYGGRWRWTIVRAGALFGGYAVALLLGAMALAFLTIVTY